MNFCNSIWLLFQLDVFQFGFLLLSSSSVFQSTAVPGGRNSISQPAQSPVRQTPVSQNDNLLAKRLLNGFSGQILKFFGQNK